MAYLDDGFDIPGVSMVKQLEIDEETRNDQCELFMTAKKRNPRLFYHQLNLEKIRETERELDGLVLPDVPEAVQAVLRQKLETTRLTCRMLIATAENNPEEHLRCSIELYGQPTPERFWGIVSRQHVPGLTPPPTVTTQPLPDPDVVQMFGERVRQEYIEVLSLVTEGDYDAKAIVALFKSAMPFYPELIADEWKAKINPNKGSITVGNEDKVIWVPPTRQCDNQEMKGRLVHELGTHVLRQAYGLRSPLKMLSKGFPEYLEGEEGVALLREQSLTGQVAEFERWEYYLSVGLALGIDGTPRDFHSVFEIMLELYEREMDEDEAINKAWERCLRLFRGTDGKVTGLCNTKDIVYYDGTASVWQALQDYPDEWRRLNVGKYNPADPVHRACLDALGL